MTDSTKVDRRLETNARVAQEAGDLAAQPAPALFAFEVDALLSMANVQRNITDSPTALNDARHLIEVRLGTARRRARR